LGRLRTEVDDLKRRVDELERRLAEQAVRPGPQK
jgi:hypothetical protein